MPESDPAGHENVRLAVKGEYGELELLRVQDVQDSPPERRRRLSVPYAKLSQEIYRKVHTPPLEPGPERRIKYTVDTGLPPHRPVGTGHASASGLLL